MSHKAVYYFIQVYLQQDKKKAKAERDLLSIFVFHFFGAVFFLLVFANVRRSAYCASLCLYPVSLSECQSVRVSECHYAMMANQRVLTAKSFVMMGRLALVLVIVLSAPLLAWAIPARPYRRAVSAYRAATHDSSWDQNKSAVSGAQV
jgi:hypothetical protein